MRDFWIERHKVTNAEFAAFLNARGNTSPAAARRYDADDADARIHLGHRWMADPGFEHHPAVEVSWFGARDYCAWKERRLPTEAEWEKAARGTDGRYFPWGNRWRSDLANAEYRIGDTTEVGSYPQGASPYGCFDMAGNVFEWTSFEFPDGKAVMKGGGSWDDQPGICRGAARHGRSKDARHILFGFRCVCEMDAATIR